MVLEVIGQAEMEGHVRGQNGTDDRLPDLLQPQSACQVIACACGAFEKGLPKVHCYKCLAE